MVTGSFPELRWPDFSDYRTHVANFYEPTGYTLAWVRGGQPTAQAQAAIELLRQADRKGLNPEDYDSSRWSERLTRLQQLPSPENQAHFDVALTVCTMRYISDLRIGRWRNWPRPLQRNPCTRRLSSQYSEGHETKGRPLVRLLRSFCAWLGGQTLSRGAIRLRLRLRRRKS